VKHRGKDKQKNATSNLIIALIAEEEKGVSYHRVAEEDSYVQYCFLTAEPIENRDGRDEKEENSDCFD
jgi:hypothetical protein